MDSHDVFVARLASTPTYPGSGLFNPYAGAADAAIRRSNLALYLRRMARRAPRLLLLGEAPGYRGCRQTGVPFTSEFVLLTEPTPFDLFGEPAGFRSTSEAGRWPREATSTTLWETIAELGTLPLLWNALPFHPFGRESQQTNRTPLLSELALGEEFVCDLLKAFQIDQVIAVGRKAAEALRRWGISATQVRHPGHGGKYEFRRGLADALAGTLLTVPGQQSSRE